MQERLGGTPGGDAAPPDPGDVLSLDKAWHGLHYLLTSEVEPVDTPLGQAVLGGVEVGDDFTGYGPARVIDPALTAAIAGALNAPELEGEAHARFDADRMVRLQIYPFGWDAADPDWLMAALRDLRRFYSDASAQGRAIVTCIE